jgi:predicted nuclease of predicted toxin-antitoxin system
VKFLVDMNLSPRWVGFLSNSGHAAVHWSAIGAPDAPDTEIMAHARANDLCVLTHDLDFGTILALTNWDKPSVVQIRADDTSPESIGDILIRALAQSADEIEQGALLTVEPARMRLRILPFRRL